MPALRNGALSIVRRRRDATQLTCRKRRLQDAALHCALSLAAQCIVIGPVCLFVGLCVCL